MQRASRPWSAITLFFACAALALSAHPGPPGAPPYPTRAVSTVEPLPPLSLDLAFTDRQEWGGGGAAVVRSEIIAGHEVEELLLSLDLPHGLSLRGVSGPPARQGRLRAGERRIHRLPVVASHDGVFPVRLEAEVRLSDGRTFQVGQGATLRFGRPEEEDGRQRHGAYEVRGRTMSELPR
ncbi:MAG TPA: hypothetical protein VFG08_02655 [Candidatus Polarisedimenticolia bacterium]|nr:hypothetical protein [Candidatus Polarisedimenticolia bacterium]